MNTLKAYIAATLCAVMLTAPGCDSNDRSESEPVDLTSAVAGEDYVAVAGTATITAGSRHTTVSVDVLGDDDGEADEALTVTLSNVSAAGAGLQINDTAAVEGLTCDFEVLRHESLEELERQYVPAEDRCLADFNEVVPARFMALRAGLS